MFLGLRRNQPIAAGSDHYRIEHHKAWLILLKRRGHHRHNLGRVQHADLDRIGTNIFKHGIKLYGQKIWLWCMDSANALGVLCGECSDRRHAVAAQRTDGFQVCLNAGTAAAVGACNGENFFGRGHQCFPTPVSAGSGSRVFLRPTTLTVTPSAFRNSIEFLWVGLS